MILNTLLSKVLKKGLRTLSKVFPHNTKYRPVGIINVSKGRPIDDIDFIQVRPPSVLTLDLSQRFVEDCSPYANPIVNIKYLGISLLASRKAVFIRMIHQTWR